MDNTASEIKKDRLKEKYLDILKKNVVISKVTEEGIAFHIKGAITDVNGNFANLLGYRMREIVGSDISRFIRSKMIENLIRNVNPDTRRITKSKNAYKQRRIFEMFIKINFHKARKKDIPLHGRKGYCKRRKNKQPA